MQHRRPKPNPQKIKKVTRVGIRFDDDMLSRDDHDDDDDVEDDEDNDDDDDENDDKDDHGNDGDNSV